MTAEAAPTSTGRQRHQPRAHTGDTDRPRGHPGG